MCFLHNVGKLCDLCEVFYGENLVNLIIRIAISFTNIGKLGGHPQGLHAH